MATRRKAKGKAKTKRKKSRVIKAAARRKTTAAKKAEATRKRPAKKVPVKRAASKKARPRAPAAVKSRPPRPPAAAAPTPAAPPQPALREERIGVVTHYFNHLAVAIVRLESGHLHVGDTIHIRGHTSDFTQRVESLEVNHAATTEVGPNDDFGLKVAEHVREHDVVYKVLRP
jgi:Elongation factor Tu domain 2